MYSRQSHKSPPFRNECHRYATSSDTAGHSRLVLGAPGGKMWPRRTAEEHGSMFLLEFVEEGFLKHNFV